MENIIFNSIDICIKNTKLFLENKENKIRNINKSINGILFINNIKNCYCIQVCDNNNILKKIQINLLNDNLVNYFNSFNILFIIPESELCLFVPITKLDFIEPQSLWNSDNFQIPDSIISEVWCPMINQKISTPKIIILKTKIESIFIQNKSLFSLINDLNYIY